MNIFETHAHLDFSDFNTDRDQLLKKCFNAGVKYIINVGIDEKTTEASIQLAEKYENVYATAAFHPHEASSYSRDIIAKLAKHSKVVAIGETGLDFFRNRSPKKDQIFAFEDQIQLANELGLPIIVHDREAHEECLEILVANDAEKVVFHCFSGDAAIAEEVLSRGWNISFTGNITYKNNRLEDAVRVTPMQNMFIETDSPFLTPHPHRGKRNSPLNLRYIIERISEIKRISPKQVADTTFNNAVSFFLEKN